MFSPTQQAFLGCPQHHVIRLYASLHLLLIYTGLLAAMPGVKEYLPWAAWEPVLRTLGLWGVTVQSTVLPLMGLVLVVCRGLVLLCVGVACVGVARVCVLRVWVLRVWVLRVWVLLCVGVACVGVGVSHDGTCICTCTHTQ